MRLCFIHFQWLGNLRSKRRQNEKIAKKAAKRQKRINEKDSPEEAILNTRIKCIRLTKASRTNKFVLQARKEEELKVNHPLSDEAILKLISDKSFIGCCGARALGKLATHDVLKTTHLTKTAPIFTFSLPCNSVLSNGAYFAFLLRK